jgi:GTP pyrophosphokinase
MGTRIGKSLIRLRDLDRWLGGLPPQLQRGKLDLSQKPRKVCVDEATAQRLLSQLLKMPPSSTAAVPAYSTSQGLVHPTSFLTRLRRLSCYGPLLEKAFRLAWEGHFGAFRKSGDPYIEHPLAVAEMAAKYGMGEKECAALLCHDLREDAFIGGKRVTREFLAKELGEEVAEMVEGITELGKEPEYEGEKPSILERYEKWLKYGSRDLSIIILKLFDRLHNMQTLEYMDEAVQEKKAKETFNVYAKIADRLGMWELKRELEDLSFKYLEPELYKEIEEKRREIAKESKPILGSKEEKKSIVWRIDQGLMMAGMRIDFDLEQRGIYELYQRMELREISIKEFAATDIWRLNIVVPEEHDCKNIEGRVQNIYSPNQNEIRNFIAEPRPNGHQFLQSYLKVPLFGELLVQIRDRSMYENYIKGVLATGKGEKEKQLLWLNVMLSIFREGGTSAREAYKTLAAYSTPIVTFSPAEDEIELPFGATVLDFAREIHEKSFSSCYGSHCTWPPR